MPGHLCAEELVAHIPLLQHAQHLDLADGYEAMYIYKEQKAGRRDMKHLHRKLTDAPIWLF